MGGEMPMPTPETPIVTPDSRVLRGELLGSLTLEAREHSRDGLALKIGYSIIRCRVGYPLNMQVIEVSSFTNPVIISGDHQIGDFFYKPNSDEWRGISSKAVRCFGMLGICAPRLGMKTHLI